METVIQTYTNGETLILTTDSPASHDGIPALRYTGCQCPDMGPTDQLCQHVYPLTLIEFFGPLTAAAVVDQSVSACWYAWHRLLSQHSDLPGLEDPPDVYEITLALERYDTVRTAAQAFCRQWPDGPQVTEDDS